MMKKTADPKSSSNSTVELTPEQARKKRERILEQARLEAEERGETPDNENPEDSSIATFILPGD